MALDNIFDGVIDINTGKPVIQKKKTSTSSKKPFKAPIQTKATTADLRKFDDKMAANEKARAQAPANLRKYDTNMQVQPSATQSVMTQYDGVMPGTLGRLNKQFKAGFAEGALFGKGGDKYAKEPDSTGEKIARIAGNLGGFGAISAATGGFGASALKLPIQNLLLRTAAREGIAGGIYGTAEGLVNGKTGTDLVKNIATRAAEFGGMGALGHSIGVGAKNLMQRVRAETTAEKAEELVKTTFDVAENADEFNGRLQKQHLALSKELPQVKLQNKPLIKILPKQPSGNNADVPLGEINLAPNVKERKFAQNVRESQVATSEIKANLDKEKLTYEPITNKETFNKATKIVEQDYNQAKEYFNSPSKGVSADDVALGEALITKAIKDGNTEEANRLIADLAEKLTTAGQAVQAASIFKRLTPEGMLLYAQRVVNSVNKELANMSWFERMGKKAKKVVLTPEDSQFILDTMRKVQRLPEGREKDIELAKIMQLIANKAPATLSEKLKGLQRISLLLNPKTMGRNVIGNTIFGAIDNISNVVATPMDKLIGLKTGKRTTTLPSIGGQLKSGVQGVKETIEDAKLGIDTSMGKTQYELPSKRIFDTEVLNKLDKATRVGLQLGDRPFYRAAFDDVLRQQMKLANVTTPTQEMIELAHKVAQQRTYQDINALTNTFKMAQRALNLGQNFGLGNIVLPFVKTPANILARAVEYSPLGVVKALKEATNIKNGAFDQRAFVDALSRTVTGTALIMVGYDLAKNGIITGSANKDKDIAAFERDLGKEDYAFKVGDTYYTYDWAQPASMALAMGADIYLKGKDRKEAESVVFDAIRSGGETLYKQSMLQGIQRFMGGYNPIDNIANTVMNAPTQAVPTLSGQIAQYTDPIQRSTFAQTGLGTTVNLIKAKIPGMSQTLEPKINTFGKTVLRNQGENSAFNVFINPGKQTNYKPNKLQREILRLYELSGDKDIFPKVAPKSFTQKGEKIVLTPKEITLFQQTMGQKTEARMNKIVNSNLSDELKIKQLKKAIDQSYEDAKKQLLKNRLK